jgi:hypothetical protein
MPVKFVVCCYEPHLLRPSRLWVVSIAMSSRKVLPASTSHQDTDTANSDPLPQPHKLQFLPSRYSYGFIKSQMVALIARTKENMMQWRQERKKMLEGCEGSRSGLLYHACSSLQESKNPHQVYSKKAPITHKSKAESSLSLGTSWTNFLDIFSE